MMCSARLRSVRAVLVLALVALAACGGSDETAPAAGGDGTAEPTLTVAHRFGSTELTGVPERIVALDPQWTDVLLAMGVQPAGYAVDSFMPGGEVPWQELSADAEPLSLDDGPPIEEIASLRPDLVVGSYSIADEATYEQLSGIAPTIADLSDQQVTPWQELVRAAGDLLDDPERAEQVIAGVDDEVAQSAAALPGLAGQTFALAQYVVGDSMYIVADERDGSSVFFQQLGMVMYPPVAAEGEATGDARINVSLERSDLLQADLLVFLVNGGDESDLADIPGFDRLPGTVAVLDYATIVGLNTPSPLSIPYAMERLRPYLEAAAATP